MRLNARQNDYWERRLDNWAVFMHGDGLGGRAKISSCYSFVALGRREDDDGIPGDVAEAMETNKLVLKLSSRHQVALVYRFVSQLPDAVSASSLNIDRTTFVHRVRHAKEALHILNLTNRFRVKPIKTTAARAQ